MVTKTHGEHIESHLSEIGVEDGPMELYLSIRAAFPNGSVEFFKDFDGIRTEYDKWDDKTLFSDD